MTPAQTLARFAVGLRHDAMDRSVVDAAARHMLDTIGVGIAGSLEEMPKRSRIGIGSLPGSAGRIRPWGADMAFTAPYAALANGISAHVLDFDDTHTAGIVHGSAIIVPVVLALGEEFDRTGSKVLEAFVAGWEVAARVGLASKGTFHKRGYHTSSIAGVFGAAAAAGKLLGLDEAGMTNALALSGSQAAGVNEYQSNGSSSKILHTGWAAHAGIVAAYLAQAGMTGPASIFEGRLGVLNAYGDIDASDTDCLAAGLGEVWEVTRISIKPYSCCHFGHAFIDCGARLKERGLRPDEAKAIECVVSGIQVPMVCEPAEAKRRPVTPYGAKFSLPYMTAVGLVDGAVTRSTFTPQNIARKDLLDVAARVSYRVAAPGETTFPDYFPGWLRVTTTDGAVLEERIDRNWGTPGNPMGTEAVAGKFRENLVGLATGEAGDRIIEEVFGIGDTPVSRLSSRISALFP